MSEKPPCYSHFGKNFANPNCDICHIRLGCYKTWNEADKKRQAIEAENAKHWNQQKPLAELFPELACDKEGGKDCG